MTQQVYRLELTEREKETVMVAMYWHERYTEETGGDVASASSVIAKLRALEPVGTEGES